MLHGNHGNHGSQEQNLATPPNTKPTNEAAQQQPLPAPRSQIVTERSLKRRQATQNTGWSIAATLLAVAGVVVLVTWLVGRSQSGERHQPTPVRLESAQTPVSAPATTTTPQPTEAPPDKSSDTVPTPPSASAEAETVELEALPVLPSPKIDAEKYRVEQAKQAAKRELASEVAKESATPAASTPRR
jgi:hypothetical protein